MFDGLEDERRESNSCVIQSPIQSPIQLLRPLSLRLKCSIPSNRELSIVVNRANDIGFDQPKKQRSRSLCPARHSSPKKLSGRRIAMPASFPPGDSTATSTAAAR